MSLSVKQIKLENTNAYLITNDDTKESILVDTGNMTDRDMLIEKLKDEKIKLIIVTHGHSNKIGNLKELSEKYNVPCFMNKNDYDLFDNQLSHEMYAEGTFSSIKLNKIKKENENLSFEKPKMLYDAVSGDTFSKYGFSDVKIVGLSGHTRGSIGVLVGKKDLIAGDILITEKNRVALPFTYEEKASLLNSLEEIKDIFPSKIYPGEGDIFNYDDYFEMEKISLKKSPLDLGNKKK